MLLLNVIVLFNFINLIIYLNISLGEQDARVLTLAEQIIAAMPDRIKVIYKFHKRIHIMG